MLKNKKLSFLLGSSPFYVVKKNIFAVRSCQKLLIFTFFNYVLDFDLVPLWFDGQYIYFYVYRKINNKKVATVSTSKRITQYFVICM